MNTTRVVALSAAGLGVALCRAVTASPPPAALIVPARSIGHVRLASYRDRDFPAVLGLGKPAAQDHAMGGRGSALWVSKKTAAGRRPNTLYIDTQGDGAGADPPTHRISVTAIRVTSPFFHTEDGIGPGSTLARIRRRYPHARRGETLTSTADDDLSPTQAGTRHTVTPYTNPARGIAFELPGAHPTRATRCTAVWVFFPREMGPHG